MIIYKNKKFSDYVDLWAYLVYTEKDLSPNMERMFPHSNYFYVKAALEEKFQRKFTRKEINQYIKETEELALKNITLKDTGLIERSNPSPTITDYT